MFLPESNPTADGWSTAQFHSKWDLRSPRPEAAAILAEAFGASRQGHLMLEFWIGTTGGVLIGSTGVGLGLIVTPLLILAGYSPAVAIGTGLGVTVVTKLFAAMVHDRLGHWPGWGVGILLAGGAAGVAVAWWFALTVLRPGRIDFDAWLKRALAVTLFLAAFVMLKIDRAQGRRLVGRGRSRAFLLPIGLGVGTLQALTSAGSGSLLTPILASTTDWEVSQMAAVSNLFGALVGALSVGLYFKLGDFNTHLFGKVLMGLLPGVLVGSLLSRRIPRHWFVRGIAVVATLIAVRLLFA
jgi:hypothetical protein